MELQHKRKEFISVQKSSIELAKEQGIEQRNVEISKNLLDILDDKTISLKTGLLIEQIKDLRK